MDYTPVYFDDEYLLTGKLRFQTDESHPDHLKCIKPNTSGETVLKPPCNPVGRTGISGVGSLPDFGGNILEYLFIVSESYCVINTDDADPIPFDFDLKHLVEPLKSKLATETGFEFHCLKNALSLDSEFNTGMIKFNLRFQPTFSFSDNAWVVGELWLSVQPDERLCKIDWTRFGMTLVSHDELGKINHKFLRQTSRLLLSSHKQLLKMFPP